MRHGEGNLYGSQAVRLKSRQLYMKIEYKIPLPLRHFDDTDAMHFVWSKVLNIAAIEPKQKPEKLPFFEWTQNQSVDGRNRIKRTTQAQIWKTALHCKRFGTLHFSFVQQKTIPKPDRFMFAHSSSIDLWSQNGIRSIGWPNRTIENRFKIYLCEHSKLIIGFEQNQWTHNTPYDTIYG